jgi:hypothetical protein
MKGEPCYFLFIPCLPFANTHASYHIGSDVTGLANAPSFYKANLSSFLDQAKHLASSLNRISLYNIYIMPWLHLSIGVWWNPSCTKNTLTKPLCLPLWKKQNDSMLCLVV